MKLKYKIKEYILKKFYPWEYNSTRFVSTSVYGDLMYEDKYTIFKETWVVTPMEYKVRVPHVRGLDSDKINFIEKKRAIEILEKNY